MAAIGKRMTLALDCATLCEEVATRGLVNMALYPPRTRENRIVKWTLDTFLDWEDHAATKHELVNGRIIEMSGGTGHHATIAANVITEVKVRTRRKRCIVFTNRLKVVIDNENVFYPDVTVVCDRPRCHDDRNTALLNPLLVVEVTSPSSMRDDRGRKLDGSKSLPSVRHELIVDQHRVFAELHARVDGGWRREGYDKLEDSIRIDALGISIPMAEVYFGVDLDTIGV